uniref:Galectin n=1 Tax=Eptatretus burgeri TaxID=7764 RepID=A0A8C4N550_EPTBU
MECSSHDLKIYVENPVTIDDFSYPEFPHRLDMQDVHAIEIAGFISLNKVSIENLEKPCDFEKNTKKYAGGVTNQVEMYRSKEPVLLALSEDSSFNCTLAGGIIDREVVLKGYTFATHERIYVLLKEMTSNDIAFQFEVRFDQRKCVINSFECGTWKKELEINHLPFQNNMDFTLKFFCDNTQIVILHQDKELGRFCHRIPPYKINQLKISDGLKIHGLTLLTK